MLFVIRLIVKTKNKLLALFLTDINLLSVVSKLFKKVMNSLHDRCHFENCSDFFRIQYGVSCIGFPCSL